MKTYRRIAIHLILLLALLPTFRPAFSATKVAIGYATITARLMPLWIAADQGTS